MIAISGATRVAAVIGSPVQHSLSPALHNAAFAQLGLDWVYVAFSIAPGDAVPGTLTMLSSATTCTWLPGTFGRGPWSARLRF